jgi:hypothetical protein
LRNRKKSTILPIRREDRDVAKSARSDRLTDIERGLERAILEDAKALRAFRNLVNNGYQSDVLLIHLNLWARVPDVLFAESLRSKVPDRDAKNRLVSFVRALRESAAEMETNPFQRETWDSGRLDRHWIIEENGGTEAAERIRCLPKTLSLYARLLEWQLYTELRAAKNDGTHLEYQADQTRIFVDEVRRRTQKDRLDSVVPLLECASRHFDLKKHFEKKALSKQLKRLRERSVVHS